MSDLFIIAGAVIRNVLLCSTLPIILYELTYTYAKGCYQAAFAGLRWVNCRSELARDLLNNQKKYSNNAH
ncbi:hypothetical protein, partial [Pseudomonas helleri]|uniref:hypothetical protein n=1 Tax=Pseudomonas helleri TaxID=1608996 RepID=UPI0021C8B84E